MEFEDGKRAIARIYSAAGEVAGVGFLVSDRYVLTCAHVVAASVEPADSANPTGATVSIALPLVTSDRKYQTQVVFYELDTTAYGKDFAILHLVTVPEVSIPPLTLAPLTDTASIELRVFGFPKGDEAGRNLSAVTRGSVEGGWEQIEDTKQTGLAIEDGFSGAPVWCEALKAFVGMVVARDKRRPEAKLGFMIPTPKLDHARQVVQRCTLLDCLEPEQQSLAEPITIAYQVCRPVGWSKPYQNQLRQRLEDLSRMTYGELQEPMLVQFVACLLNQGLPETVHQVLEIWAKRYTADLNALRVRLQDKQKVKPNLLPTQQSDPCLLVSVKSHETKAQHSYVSAWFVSDVSRYDAATGQGAEALVMQHLGKYADAKDLNPEAGIPDAKIPVLLADYLEQVGNRGVDLRRLTVELLLPLTLMNEPIEQRLIPVEYGLPESLAKNCRVVVRSQERLEGYRALGRWQTKWQQLQDSLENSAGRVFVSGTENLRQLQRQLSQEDKLGLQLTRSPSTSLQGELGILLGTGAPVALWVRQEAATVDWESQLARQVFGCLDHQSGSGEPDLRCCLAACSQPPSEELGDGCRSIQLAALPQRVSTIRQNAPHIEEESSLNQSPELGHHLSFLWEDPKRVPPNIIYS